MTKANIKQAILTISHRIKFFVFDGTQNHVMNSDEP
jgi:hypothetical protein